VSRSDAAHDLLSEIMAVAPNGIMLCSADLVVRKANPAALEKLRCNKDSVIGQPLANFFPNADTFAPGGQIGPFVYERGDAKTGRRGNGEEFPVEIRGFYGPIGDRIRCIVFFHDISRRVQAEEARKQFSQQIDEIRRLEAIGALSAGIAHEINTPMQYIGDNIEFVRTAISKIQESYRRYDALSSAVEADPRYAASVAEIRRFDRAIELVALTAEIEAAIAESQDGVRQVRDIIRLMKDFAHPGTGAKEPADLNLIIQNVVALSRNRRKGVAEVDLALDPDLPLTSCRRGQVQQVILNIVMNAIDAVEEAHHAAGRVRIASSCDGANARIFVSDDGNGVPPSLRARIFDPFFTTKPVGKGTGQGLALAMDCIVKGHGGRLSLVDVEGFATTFLIELPVRAAEGEGAAENVQAA
jgi:signal transduction histidine kinase